LQSTLYIVLEEKERNKQTKRQEDTEKDKDLAVRTCTGFECLLRSRGGMTDSVLPLTVRFTCGQSAYDIPIPTLGESKMSEKVIYAVKGGCYSLSNKTPLCGVANLFE
ncbi:hypothetical protein C0J52_17747, partial [Blattella germanica]